MVRRLADVRLGLIREGMDVPRLSGQLLRPRSALYMVPAPLREGLSDAFWMGCLAIQMVHEASLLHDDVIDGAAERRGQATVAATSGCGTALLLGDLYLTGAYRVAGRVGSARFGTIFADAVHRTVVGERLQAESDGRVDPVDVLRGKTGALFGAALALSSDFGGALPLHEAQELGVEIGVLYQMVDDFLDYCPSADTGKPPLQDFRRRVRTWVVPDQNPPPTTGSSRWFDQPEDEAVEAFFRQAPAGPSLAERALETLRSKGNALVQRVNDVGGDPALSEALSRWVHRCETASSREAPAGWTRWTLAAGTAPGMPVRRRSSSSATSAPEPGTVVTDLARAVGPREDWAAYFRSGSRSFSLAASLFPAEARHVVTGIYAFCRFTDDLVDDAPVDDPVWVGDALDAWAGMCRSRYAGGRIGVPLVDEVIGAMRERNVPLDYVVDLIRGMAMDVRPSPFATLSDLRIYTYRAASVVGGWMTRSFGVEDPWVLERAYALGHAMQLTNILRDVGEDLDRGRLYLPDAALVRHGVTVEDLRRIRRGGRIPPRYQALIEELMAVADADYRTAFEGLPHVPPFFARPVSAAARIYQGIHDRIRSNGYDNLTLRAYAGGVRKLALGAGGLWRLRRARKALPGVPSILARDAVETG